MRIGYIDCFAGIAGDMMLGALLDAGVPFEVMDGAVRALGIGARLKTERVDRSGIMAAKVWVMEGERIADGGDPDAEIPHREHTHGGDSFQHQAGGAPMQVQPRTQHLHKGGHHHEHGHSHSHEEPHSHEHGTGDHEHGHVHGRSLVEIRKIIRGADLDDAVKTLAVRAFELLGASEAKVHGVPVEEIHFHEVGAVDAIADIVGASAGLVHLRVGKWFCSAVNTGSGTVQCAHGRFPVPAPATADLLRGLPTYAANVEKELTTPTGAAVLRALEPTAGAQPAMAVDRIGYGAGTRNPEGFPNVLRLMVGEAASPGQRGGEHREATASGMAAHEHSHAGQTVAVLETALDDASPQVLAYVAEQALRLGALDVMLAPVVMKKGRPGTLVTVLCEPDRSAEFERMLLRETTTLGVRVREDRRSCLDRAHAEVETAYGRVRVKIGSLEGEVLNAAPEFEDCRAVAERSGVALKTVQQAAQAAWLETSGKAVEAR